MIEFITTVNDISSAWGSLILRSCWQGGLALGIVWLLCRAITRMTPAARCWLWRLAYLKLLVAFFWVSPVELAVLAPQPADDPAAAAAVSAPEGNRPKTSAPGDASRVIEPATGQAQGRRSSGHPVQFHAVSWLFGIWIIGVGACFAKLIYQWVRIRGLVSRLPRVSDQRVIDLAAECCRSLGLRRPPALLQADAPGSPFLAGSLRPAIVLPSPVLSQTGVLHTALAHELAHWKRNDLLWNWLPALAEVLFFFHPLVWLARREWRVSQEVATDEVAVLKCGFGPERYGRGLVELVEQCSATRARGHMAVAVSETYAHLSRRLIAMKSFRPRSRTSRRAMLALIAIIAVAGIVPWKVTAREPLDNGQSFPAPAVAKVTDAPVKDDKPAKRTMRVRVLDGSDGQPLAGAKVHLGIWTDKPFDHPRDYVCDAEGEAVTVLPEKPEILRIWARKKGHVPMFAQWWPEEQPDGHLIPEEFTFRLPEGTSIGGFVKNEDGQPIEGAKVEVRGKGGNFENELSQRPCFDIWLAYGEAAQATNAQGRWSLNNMPAGEEHKVLVKLSHPDYISDTSWGGLQGEQDVTTESFREGTATIVMSRGIRVTGTVTDPDGNAVPGAVVIWGDDPYFQEGSQEVRTDENGRYRLAPLPEGPMHVTVVAKAWAPARKKINIRPDVPPLDFRLQPGKTLRMKFVDTSGDPVPGVGVSIAGWRGAKSLFNYKHPNVVYTQIPRKADENGVYKWTWAPDDAVVFAFYKEGYRVFSSPRSLRPGQRSLRAGEKQHKIVLYDAGE